MMRDDVACVAGVLRDLVRAAGQMAVRDDSGRIALVHAGVADLGGRVPASIDVAAEGVPLAPDPGWFRGRRVQALSYAGDGIPHSASRSAQRAAEREFLRSLDNPRDGYFDRVLNRRLSRPLTLLLLPLRVTPNQITVAALLLSLVGAACIALPGLAGPVLGALLLQLTAVLDCVDGEIARAKVLETEWGEWLDITSDTLIHVATFLGIAVHAWPDLGRATAWTLGALFTVGGLASFVVVTRAEKTEDTWKQSRDWRARLLALLLATLTTRDLSVLVLVAAVANLLTPLLVGAAFGAQVFWCGTLVLHASVMRRAA
ncbi:CDP-alcohol phosphatidyltransferase family protein [Candidatus Binatia bacterium]|nr:CDP-alcohol phosphatidyltransferase family protein [Candidatus Binatia bacterium]